MQRLAIAILFLGTFIAAAGGQDDLDYTALGDSIATGYLSTAGYVVQYADTLREDTSQPVALYNLAQNGWSSGNLLNALRGNATIQAAVGQADLITWNIGLNDWRNARSRYKSGKCSGKDNQDCLRAVVGAFKSNWDGVLNELLNRRMNALVPLRTFDIFNPWAALDIGANVTADAKEIAPARGDDFTVLAYYLTQMNSHIELTAVAHGIHRGAAHAAFNGVDGREDPRAKGYIGSDGVHPTETGHYVLASLLR